MKTELHYVMWVVVFLFGVAVGANVYAQECDDCAGMVSDWDDDGDGVDDIADNCPQDWNAPDPVTGLQYDKDGDGIGDMCDECTGPNPCPHLPYVPPGCGTLGT
jgi:hypothetical protein